MTLHELTAAWIAAKADENAANKRRVEIETQIAAAMPAAATEQTVHAEIDGYKVSVKYGVTRKVDTEKLQQLWDKLPGKAQEVFRWKADVSLPKLRALQDLLPTEYSRVAQVIEAKPSKPSVSVELMEKEAA